LLAAGNARAERGALHPLHVLLRLGLAGHLRRAILVLCASFAIAVTHWLKGVPFMPATCFFGSPWQNLPYAFAFACGLAFGPGVDGLWPLPPPCANAGPALSASTLAVSATL